jgi:nitroimidazol reductase NimA-like FMN-containing flavoprotein (pyridoxamine 5'-phosphate oxidase superfamily)
VGRLGVDDLEDLRSARLGSEAIEELLDTATEATLVFAADHDGWPQGVVVSFARFEGSFWLTAVEGRVHVRGLRRDPRAALVVTNAGTGLEGRRMVSVRGRAVVHSDRETKDRILPVLARRLAPADPAAMLRLLDSERRVVVQLADPEVLVSHDSRRIAGDGRGGPADGTVDRAFTI